MTRICQCPLGFEDGKIVSYRAEQAKFELSYEFWNGQKGVLRFEGFIAARDSGALGVEVGSVKEELSSDFLDMLISRLFVQAPAILNWKHFQFLDLDDSPMFEIVAESGSFTPIR